MKRFLKGLRLYFLSFKLRFSENVAYRSYLLSHSLAILAHAFFRVTIVLIADNLGQGIPGWSTYQLVLLAGIHQVYVSLLFLFIYRQMMLLIRNINLGQLEHDLVKPIDSQLAIALKGGNLNNVFGVILGIIIIAFSLIKLNTIPLPTSLLAAVVFLFFGLLTVYCFMFLGSIMNFWFQRVENARDFGAKVVANFNRFPADAYHQAGTVIYFLLLPLTLTTTIPTQALLGKFNLSWIIILVFSSLGLFFLSRQLWHFALKHYTSASS
jgi:ABC-2 type transport system permease protein